MIELYFGFHRPYFRNLKGRIDPRGWLGHCEVWGCNEDGTWLVLDPQGQGCKILVTHRYDDVAAQLKARLDLCESILRIPAREPSFALPLHGPMTCASICGALVGIRALVPASLRRRLLAQGAEVVHEAEGRSPRQGSA